jgi:hypothetical protein
MFKRLLLSISVIAAICASAAAQERQWSLDAGGEDVYLVFGVPETDDVGISFWCTLETGRINIFVPEADAALKPGMAVRFTITADKTVAKLKGKTTANEEAGTTSLEAKIPGDHPIFAALQLADRFKVKVGKEENVFPLIDADVAGLLALCKKP